MSNIEVTHDLPSAGQWDWPLQHNDGVVRLRDLPDHWEIDLDTINFTPKEIEVKVAGDHLIVHCRHEVRNDEHGSISREVFRSYKLPENADTTTIKSHLTSHGVLRISAQKK